MKAIDYAYGRPSPQKVKDAGYVAAIRYISDQGRMKNMNVAEVQAYAAVGLPMVTVFELNATRTRDGMAAGQEDGASAAVQAHLLGQPHGTLIYFAVDYNAPVSDYAAITDYFRGVLAGIGPYLVGGYGKDTIGRHLKDRSLVRKWWQSKAWSEGRHMADASLYQGKQVDIDGVTVDVNDVLEPNFGQWKPTMLSTMVYNIGYTESPAGSNCNKFSYELGRPCQSWCADAVVSSSRRAGVNLPSESAWTPTMAGGFMQVGRWGRTPEIGALAFFNFPGDGVDRIQHVGIVESFNDQYVTTIDGNTSSGPAGSQSDGGGVFRRTRPRAWVVGFGYFSTPALPSYSAKEYLNVNITQHKIRVVLDANGNGHGDIKIPVETVIGRPRANGTNALYDISPALREEVYNSDGITRLEVMGGPAKGAIDYTVSAIS